MQIALANPPLLLHPSSMTMANDTRTFAKQSALVTGGSRGIGRAIALALGARGARVAVNYLRDAAGAEDVVARIHEQGGTALALQGDVRDAAAVQQMVQRVIDQWGAIDMLVNNAGLVRDKPLMFTTDAEWNEVVDTCLKGAFHGIKAVARPMTRQRGGRIVNIASDAGLLGDLMRAGYASAKAGLLGLTRTAARELAAAGVTVNAVAPGMIDTDLIAPLSASRKRAMLERIPMGRFGTPAEVADVVLALLSDTGRYITGATLCVDGGLYMG